MSVDTVKGIATGTQRLTFGGGGIVEGTRFTLQVSLAAQWHVLLPFSITRLLIITRNSADHFESTSY